MPTKTWSPQQIAIFDEFKNGKGHVILDARAGCGKTTTVIEGVEHAPEPRILLCAFNKIIAEELKSRIRNPRAQARTLHSLGNGIVFKRWGRTQVDERRGQKIAANVIGLRNPPRGLVAVVAKLAALGKNIAPFASQERLIEIAIDFDLADELADIEWDEDLDLWTIDEIAHAACECMEKATIQDGSIDYDDMVYLPVRCKWAHPQFDLVIVDECFPGDTPILLHDKTTLPISEIVEKKLPVKVLSFDEKSSRQVVRRVTGVKKILLQKKTIRITTRQVGYRADGQRMMPLSERVRFGTRHLVCTEDHKIFVGGEWKAASSLKIGDRLQLESAAPRSRAYNNHYKHGAAGKERLRNNLNKRAKRIHKDHTGPGFKERGGNGAGLSIPQKALLAALGSSWTSEYVITTGGRISGRQPYHYKIDIAHPGCRIAIEVDGSSHNSKKRKEADARKDTFLKSKGWTIHRFKNLDAIRNASEIAANMPTNCPVEAEVIEVVEHPIKDYYVYDLQIEGTHCYYAHGILVHNCQDMNATQIALARAVSAGRIIAVGDPFQAVYAFRGADSQSMARLEKELGAKKLSLTTTYRCPRKIVEMAQKFVPDFTAAPEAPEGTIETASEERMTNEVQAGNFILSRKNAPLARICLALLRAGKRAVVRGRDIGKGLMKVIERLEATDLNDAMGKLGDWQDRAVQTLVAQKAPESKIEFIHDQAETIRELAVGLASIEELRARLESLFSDNNIGSAVICSTVHKAKGLESDRVYTLESTFFVKRKNSEVSAEELNIRYVAITRSKDTLVLVN